MLLLLKSVLRKLALLLFSNVGSFCSAVLLHSNSFVSGNLRPLISFCLVAFTPWRDRLLDTEMWTEWEAEFCPLCSSEGTGLSGSLPGSTVSKVYHFGNRKMLALGIVWRELIRQVTLSDPSSICFVLLKGNVIPEGSSAFCRHPVAGMNGTTALLSTLQVLGHFTWDKLVHMKCLPTTF